MRLEAFEEIATFAESVFHGALHTTEHRGVAVIKEIAAGRGGLAYEQRCDPFWTKPRPYSLNRFHSLGLDGNQPVLDEPRGLFQQTNVILYSSLPEGREQFIN